MRRTVAVAWATCAVACAANRPGCRPGEAPLIADTLYLGAATSDGTVAADDWANLLERSVAPRFPQGFSTWEGDGRWRTASGVVQRERTLVVHIVHRDDAAAARAIDEIVDEYKRRFGQEAVLRVRAPVCARF